MPTPLQVAIVGSGPSGLYVAEGLSGHNDVRVDVLERLPCPYGLLRYGVAPDHFRIKGLTASFSRILEQPGVRFLGGVELGRDVTVPELRRHYDAVVYATGAPAERRLGIPGEDLPQSTSAGRLVSWYNGHPESQDVPFELTASSVAVFGMGNVALDIARMLSKDATSLRSTDVPDCVLEGLQHSSVTDVHIVGRRGPLQARFSTKELRELAALDNVDVIVNPAELAVPGQDTAGQEQTRNLRIFREWANRPTEGRPRRVHFRFGLQPVEFRGAFNLEQVVLERTAPDGSGTWSPTGEQIHLDAQMAVRSVGFQGVALPGVPFDTDRCVIPQLDGRLVRSGAPSRGEYVVGWIGRGPSGVIGTNKAHALEIVTAIIEDRPILENRPPRDPDPILDLLSHKGIRPVRWADWRRTDAAEIDRGRTRGAERVKGPATPPRGSAAQPKSRFRNTLNREGVEQCKSQR